MEFVGKGLVRTEKGLVEAARAIGCERAVLKAVLDVETGGSGFDRLGRPKALFEPHVFYRLLNRFKDKTRLQAAIKAGLAYSKWGTKPYPLDSYPRIIGACKIDEELALRSTSWGLPQIVGMNHEKAGYGSAREMVEAFKSGEDEQLAAMARFIKVSNLAGALIAKDWAAFAKGYNGPAYKVHAYDVKLGRAYTRAVRESAAA
jgi:hypothetical protein